MIEQLLRDPHRLAALAHVALLDTPIEASFDRFTRLARLAVDAPIALIVLLDADRQFFKSTAGVPAAVASARQTPLSYSLCQYMLVTQTPLVIPDLRTHPLVRDNPTVVEFGMGAYVGMPLVTDDGYMLGSLCVYDTVSRAWTEREVAILADLTVLVMTELALQERVRREEALTHATTHDSLTRLPNRSAFLAHLARALAAPDSRPHSRSVLFVDLDGFKAINDRYGHAVGDQALIAVATRLEIGACGGYGCPVRWRRIPHPA